MCIRDRVKTVRDAQALKRTPITARNAITHLVLPVLTALLTHGSARGTALETAGYDLPGARTVLRPVPDSTLQRAVRWTLPVVCVGVALWI